MVERRAIMWPWRRTSANKGIDLGGGRLVPAEDLLEGHYRRIAYPLPIPAQPAAVQDVHVQVDPAMSTAIRVVAPTLAPLAQVAEEVAAKLTSVKPTAQFRADLHRALEAELQRRLADEETPRAAVPVWVWAIAGVISAIGLAGASLWFLQRRD